MYSTAHCCKDHHVSNYFEDDGGDSVHVTRKDDIRESEIDPLTLHDMAVTAKFVPLSKMFLNWLFASSHIDAEFPFSLSKSENDIVRHPDSLLLCGRSGTGKTSCIVFRMLSMYYAYYSTVPKFLPKATVELGHHLHQIFITASPAFCAKVRAYFEKLVQAVNRGKLLDGNSTDTTIADRTHLFLTAISASKHDSDSKLGPEMNEELERILNSPKEAIDVENEALDDDIEETLVSSVPDSLMDLQSHHFPLFITYRKFVSIIRNAVNGSVLASESTSTSDQDSALPSELEYFKFLHRYWPLIDTHVKGKIHPVLADNEFMGVIKGSEKAAQSANGYLSREEYENLSTRSFSTFKGARRELYDLFLEYQKKKGFEKDVLDSINEVNRVLLNDGYKGPAIHEIYIDEVQDLTMAQLLPLVTICSSPGRGLMFAGDTAQTIARGSSFRFQDLSSMIYRSLEDRDRSHDGILRVAASVLDLIKKYFPNSIDDLARDVGSVHGPLPVCLVGNNKDPREVSASIQALYLERMPASQHLALQYQTAPLSSGRSK
ncbi:hypothetical protein HDU97_002994 [Phlyctochytrium planicorne]|nr:hypothetical protein HDU97_002994 [Phlyctochytrium planicorne]